MNVGYSPLILNELDPEWRSRKITAVTFPAPPVRAKGVIYAEDAWRSDALERGEEIFRGHKYTVLESAFTDRGPAFLIQYTLSELFTRAQLGVMVVPESIYCATISYATLLETSSTKYATDAVLEDIMSISSSCHPGSHTAVPMAPWLTLLLELERAERKEAQGFIFADDIAAGRYFPDYDFSSNASTDVLFQYATLSDCVPASVKELRLYPVLSERITGLLLPRLQSNEKLGRGLGPIQRMLRIEQRNKLSLEVSHGS